jgi:hypothetical protein
MGTLRSYARKKGKPLLPGTTSQMYLGIVEEVNGWPRTKDIMEVIADPQYTIEAGDSKILYEAFDFSNAPAGAGYFRLYPILVDSGDVRNLLEGEIGGQGFKQELGCFLEGVNPAANEAADCMLGYSGCLFAIVPDKNGLYHCIGTPENPLYVQQANGSMQGKVGYDYIFMAKNGLTHSFYDADQFGIDLTPN